MASISLPRRARAKGRRGERERGGGREVRNKGGRNNVARSRSPIYIQRQNVGAIPGLCASRYCLASIYCLRTALETVSGYVIFKFTKWNKGEERDTSCIRISISWSLFGRYIMRIFEAISSIIPVETRIGKVNRTMKIKSFGRNLRLQACGRKKRRSVSNEITNRILDIRIFRVKLCVFPELITRVCGKHLRA